MSRRDTRHNYKSFKLERLQKMIDNANEDIALLDAKKEALVCTVQRYKEAYDILEKMIAMQKKHNR